MAIVYVPVPLRRQTGGQTKVEVAGSTVGEVLANLGAAYPGLNEQILDPAGQVRAYINIFVNSTEMRTLRGQATPVGPKDEISIIPAMAGGVAVPAMAGGAG